MWSLLCSEMEANERTEEEKCKNDNKKKIPYTQTQSHFEYETRGDAVAYTLCLYISVHIRKKCWMKTKKKTFFFTPHAIMCHVPGKSAFRQRAFLTPRKQVIINMSSYLPTFYLPLNTHITALTSSTSSTSRLLTVCIFILICFSSVRESTSTAE